MQAHSRFWRRANWNRIPVPHGPFQRMAARFGQVLSNALPWSGTVGRSSCKSFPSHVVCDCTANSASNVCPSYVEYDKPRSPGRIRGQQPPHNTVGVRSRSGMTNRSYARRIYIDEIRMEVSWGGLVSCRGGCGIASVKRMAKFDP